MSDKTPYRFQPVTPGDALLLQTWLCAPHVKEWWDSDIPFDAKSLADPHVDRRIVSFEGRRFAYLQDYSVHGWEDHHFFDLPAGTRGMDQYIGEVDMIGHGHGTRFMKAWASALFQNGAPVVVTDPHPQNARAIAAYKKVGFEVFGATFESKWGEVLPMQMARPENLQAND